MAIGNTTEVSDRIPDEMRFQCENNSIESLKVAKGNVKERFQCPKCDKQFGHKQILQLHLRVHDSNIDDAIEASQKEKKDVLNETKIQDLSKKSNCMQTNNERLQSSPTNKKLIGLTKIRLEDCLRCDACSCIYLDARDYNKHMKNFHRQDSPKKYKSKKGCRSCCKHCNCSGKHQNTSLQKERGNNNLFHYNIKDRWSKMVSTRLSPEEIKQGLKSRQDLSEMISRSQNPEELKQDIKSDPDYDANDTQGLVDYSHLLSQVEVKIKTEPPDDPEYEKNMDISS
ncbi:hypothetical protein C0J52_19288 [Blattella germanica]|nr:hypothetical protein C0J52_19288 [Blattella germanica]